MEATTKVRLKSLEPYRHLFPRAIVVDKTVKKGASVEDTVHFIPEIVKKTAWQVEDYVEQELKGLSTYDACRKLWDFVKYHIEYRPDKRGLEQVRSPRRLIHDGFGDCDCGTTFILTCLYVLKIPNCTRRITKYKEDRFQHIYPVVELENGKEIIVDFVVHQFNYEEPYTEKKDYKMDLQFLDGIEDRSPSLYGVDAQDLYGGLGDIGELGQLLRRAKRGGGGGAKPGLFKKKTPEQKKQKKEDRRKKIMKVVNKVNKINPGVALLRAGILASMKLNLLKVAERLKWAYATKELAVSKGMEPAKHDKLKEVLARAEKIFYTAGGKPENLRKAILTGRGNRSKEVAGFDGYSENTPLSELLGAIYQDEFSGLEGLDGDGFGVVTAAATGASITAATGVMAAIAGLLKQVGVLFPNKDGEKKRGLFKRKDSAPADQGGESNESSSESSETSEPSEESSSESESQESSETSEPTEESSENLPAVNEESAVTTTDESSEESETAGEEETSGLSGLGGIRDFYQKNKKWIVPVGVLATAITLGLVINHYANKSEAQPKPQTQPLQQPTVNGIDGRKKRRRTKGGGGGTYGKQSVIALM